MLRDRQQGRCAICGDLISGQVHIDHRLPQKHGGTNHPDNIYLTHSLCNLRKGDRLAYFPPNGGQGMLALGL